MRLSNARFPLFCAAVLLAAIAIATPASAKTHHRSGATKVLQDCVHHGWLTHRYSVRDLRAALHGGGKDQQNYTDCSQVIDSAIAAAKGAVGHNTVGSVLADCHAHIGVLRHRYRVATLRRARHVKHHPLCQPAIETQIHALS
jgi:hypothetical protein